MAILNLFSKRQKQLRGEGPDVYTYSELPEALRAQIVHILLDTLGGRGNDYSDKPWLTYKEIVEALCREYGVFRLPPAKDYGDRNYIQELVSFILAEPNHERVLDAVEISFRLIDSVTRRFDYLRRQDASACADSAIDELNIRFKENGVGFEFVNRDIIRIDSEYVHAEIVKPALALLSDKQFAGVQQEFLSAHSHYRSGKTKECLNDCLKAIESMMKAICDKRGWAYKTGASAKDLIQACLDHNLIPAFWQQHFASLRSALESGVPTGRNKLSGHGQGGTPLEVPKYIAAYMLHSTASTLIFLGEANANLK